MDGAERGSALWLSAVTIVMAGAVLGVSQNAMVGGVAWIYQPPPSPPPLPGGIAEIPDVPWPLEVTVEVVRVFVDKQTAAIIDARDAEDYLAGHIPGAINMPFHESVGDVARLARFDPKGRPILVYCGGATCELSKQLGDALIKAGQKRVLVYTDGWPDWSQRQYPIETGPPGNGA